MFETVGPEAADASKLDQLMKAADGVDDVLQQVLAQVSDDQSRRHSMKNVTDTGSARLAAGDEVAPGASVTGYGHRYEDISASDHSQVMLGNRCEGEEFLG